MADFAKMNEVYTTYWGDVKPCRTYVPLQSAVLDLELTCNVCSASCVAVKTLPLNTDVEIECTALL